MFTKNNKTNNVFQDVSKVSGRLQRFNDPTRVYNYTKEFYLYVALFVFIYA